MAYAANSPCEELSVGFHLEIPEFYPEAFSFSPFVREHAGADVEICDWIDNAITVHAGLSSRSWGDGSRSALL